MANIRRRQGRWQAQVRRKGYSQVTKTFTSKEAAKRWIKAVETDMERGEFKPRLDMTVGQLIKRYQTDIIPKQKAHQSALVRCTVTCFIKNPIFESYGLTSQLSYLVY